MSGTLTADCQHSSLDTDQGVQTAVVSRLTAGQQLDTVVTDTVLVVRL